jgi:hypothetical protein
MRDATCPATSTESESSSTRIPATPVTAGPPMAVGLSRAARPPTVSLMRFFTSSTASASWASVELPEVLSFENAFSESTTPVTPSSFVMPSAVDLPPFAADSRFCRSRTK